MNKKDYEQIYDNFWKDIIEKDGKINLDQLKKELYDYHTLLEQVPNVYMHVTGGKISKPNTMSFEVNDAADEYYEEFYKDIFNE